MGGHEVDLPMPATFWPRKRFSLARREACVFLADENFPGEAVIALREHGHDVARVRNESCLSR